MSHIFIMLDVIQAVLLEKITPRSLQTYPKDAF